MKGMSGRLGTQNLKAMRDCISRVSEESQMVSGSTWDLFNMLGTVA